MQVANTQESEKLQNANNDDLAHKYEEMFAPSPWDQLGANTVHDLYNDAIANPSQHIANHSIDFPKSDSTWNNGTCEVKCVPQRQKQFEFWNLALHCKRVCL